MAEINEFKTVKITKTINSYNENKQLKRFSKFYRRLQDVNNLIVRGTSPMFGYSKKPIVLMWMIYLELDSRGKFFDYSDDQYVDLEKGIEYEITMLFRVFHFVSEVRLTLVPCTAQPRQISIACCLDVLRVLLPRVVVFFEEKRRTRLPCAAASL